MTVVTIDTTGVATDELLDALEALEADYDVVAQAVDADYVAGQAHIERAWAMVERARAGDRMIADDLAMEWLLYLAGTRQIDRALNLGIGEDTDMAAILIQGERAGEAGAEVRTSWPTVDATLGARHALEEWFEVTAAESGATTASLEKLVCERVVLLQLEV